ncbi:sensor histidine kinase [Lacticaseibacillus saniviri]
MPFRIFLKAHIANSLFFLLALFVFDLILWLDPLHQIQLNTVLYVSLIVILMGMVALGWRYQKTNAWLKEVAARRDNPEQALDWPLLPTDDPEQAVVANAFNSVLKAHHGQLERLLNEQQDQKAFIDSWVHEIKVPLAAGDLLVDSLDGQIPESTFEQLTLQLDRISFYVDQVLYYSRLDSFSHDYLLQEYPLKQIINDVVVSLRNQFISNQIQFELRGEDQTVLTDQKWLRFILSQIMVNSLKYTDPGGKITVTLSDQNNEVQLAVSDTGIGIAPDELHRVFDKGFTGQNGRNANQKATGLGLYLADRLGQKLNHQLTIESELGHGTTVIIHFPYLSYYQDTGVSLTHNRQ